MLATHYIHVLMGVSVLIQGCMYNIINVTHMYLPSKTSSSLAHSVNRMRE